MNEENPYRQPQADVVGVAPAGDELTLTEPRKVTVGEALAWIADGMKMLSGHWGVVIVALVVTFLISTVVQFVPLIGGLAQPFLMTLLYAGVVKIFHRIDRENQSSFADLFAGFSERTAPLLLLSLAQLVIVLALSIIGGAFVFTSLGIGAMGAQGMDAAMAGSGLGIGMLFGILIGIVLMVLVAFLFYFAVPLVMLTNTGPLQAMALSFQACLKNLIPMIIYGIVVLVILSVAAIPALLGWLFVMPILSGAFYLSFRQVLTGK